MPMMQYVHPVLWRGVVSKLKLYNNLLCLAIIRCIIHVGNTTNKMIHIAIQWWIQGGGGGGAITSPLLHIIIIH